VDDGVLREGVLRGHVQPDTQGQSGDDRECGREDGHEEGLAQGGPQLDADRGILEPGGAVGAHAATSTWMPPARSAVSSASRELRSVHATRRRPTWEPPIVSSVPDSTEAMGAP